jgi:hypothetical protein
MAQGISLRLNLFLDLACAEVCLLLPGTLFDVSGSITLPWGVLLCVNVNAGDVILHVSQASKKIRFLGSCNSREHVEEDEINQNRAHAVSSPVLSE